MAKHKVKDKDADKKAKGKKSKEHKAEAQAISTISSNGAHTNGATEPKPMMSRKEHDTEVAKLQVELVKLQEWAKHTGAKICILFEGRDAAGKGGIIKRITERTSPRVFRVVAMPSPSDREKSQMYIQRYLPHLPAAGEIVLFDRSWYNRAGVERVMGFATDQQVETFLKLVPGVERMIIASGVILLKYWLEVSMENQTERFEERINDYVKIWKLSPMDLESHRRWYDFSRARDDMFAATDTPESPWYVVDANDQRRARLNCISHILSKVPYYEVPHEKVKLPDRQKPDGYEDPAYPYRYVPENY
jgi:polyphosphate kinase 2